MNAPKHRIGRPLLTLLLLVVLSLAALPAPAAQAQPPPKWAAWALSVDFSGGSMQVLYKAYVATYASPPVIIGWHDEDITASCVTSTGAPITFAGDYAVFDGSYYITCTVPSWRESIRAIDPALWPWISPNAVVSVGDGPVWAAADIVLDPVTALNPVLDAQDLGVSFSLPRTGKNAQTKIALSGGSLTSPGWKVDDLAGNRVLLGTYGVGIEAFHDQFGWLGFLADPRWQGYFSTNASGLLFSHWAEAPTQKGTRVAGFGSYTLATRGGEVHIGYSASGGSYFFGKIRSIRFDPGSQGL